MQAYRFNDIVATIKALKLNCAPFNEADIERGIEQHLKAHGVPVKRQVVKGLDRFDLMVGKVVIECKYTGFMNVAAQLDRYSSSASGLILVCWRATKPLKELFKLAKNHMQIPVELIEISKSCDVV